MLSEPGPPDSHCALNRDALSAYNDSAQLLAHYRSMHSTALSAGVEAPTTEI